MSEHRDEWMNSKLGVHTTLTLFMQSQCFETEKKKSHKELAVGFKTVSSCCTRLKVYFVTES